MGDQVLRVQSRLTVRDHVLLGWLFDHGVLTTFQIAHALFPSLDFAQRRLLELYRAAVLDRFRPQRPGGGSWPYHYVIDQLGAEVVAAQRGEAPPRRDRVRTRRRQYTSYATFGHLLGLNQFFIDLAGYARTRPGASLQRWWPESRCGRMGAFAADDDPMMLKMLVLGARPDGHGVWSDNGARVSFFLEHDTGSEPLWRLTDKLAGYEAFVQAGGPCWPVLFWLHSAAREHHLHQRLAGMRLRVPVATAAREHAGSTRRCPAEDVWYLHGGGGGRVRLVDLAGVQRVS